MFTQDWFTLKEGEQIEDKGKLATAIYIPWRYFASL